MLYIKSNNDQTGFSLIELMIVVAIIGILAAIAIPAYQTYTKRVHVAEGINMADNVKTSVSEYYSSTGTWPTNNVTAGLPTNPTALVGNAVNSITVNESQITISYNTSVTSGRTLVFKGTDLGGSIKWSCTSVGGLTIDNKYRPGNCR